MEKSAGKDLLPKKSQCQMDSYLAFQLENELVKYQRKHNNEADECWNEVFRSWFGRGNEGYPLMGGAL